MPAPTCNQALPSYACFEAARRHLSLREATELAEVSEQRVRKDIENGVLREPVIHRADNARLVMLWTVVFTLAAVYGNEHLPSGLRKRALDVVCKSTDLHRTFNVSERTEFMRNDTWPSSVGETGFWLSDLGWDVACDLKIEVDKYLIIDFARVLATVRPRVLNYIKGLARVEEREDILGGEAVFKGSRLPVVHIGGMAAHGEKVANILEDYPSLTQDDIEFAKMYFRAHPQTGRPRAKSDGKMDATPYPAG